MSWAIVYTNQAKRDAKKLSRSGLKPQAEKLLKLLSTDPYQKPPPYEKLVGDLLVPTICIYEVFKKVLNEQGEAEAFRAISQMKLGKGVNVDEFQRFALSRVMSWGKGGPFPC